MNNNDSIENAVQVVMLIDKAFNYGLEVLLMRPDLFEDYVDNELRLFLLDGPRVWSVPFKVIEQGRV